MKLFLSSDHLGNNPKKFLDLFSDNKNVAIISNSKDAMDPEEKKQRTQVGVQILRELGLIPEDIDLRDYFDKKNSFNKKENLRKKFNKFGAVWVRGGNTFILRRAMKESGLDELLKEKISDKKFVYGGYSAGSCVVTPNLRGLEFVDEPNLIPEGYKSEVIWDGLGLVDYSIVPHYRSDHPESLDAEKTVKYLEENNIPFKTLRDGEVIIAEIV